MQQMKEFSAIANDGHMGSKGHGDSSRNLVGPAEESKVRAGVAFCYGRMLIACQEAVVP